MRTLLLVLALAASSALADAAKLKVGVAGSVPFVSGAAEPAGLSVDTFQAIAASAGLDYTLVPVATVNDAVAQVGTGELDVAIGPISVTAQRLRSVSFTQPYFRAGLSALTRPSHSTLWSRLAPVFSEAFAVGLGVLLLVLGAVGTVLWLLERRANPQQFPPGVKAGVGAGIWLALVTMSTVGYGDKAPVTTRGRVFTGAWMLISMMFASSLTAGIAAALTSAQQDTAISRPADLKGQRVATVVGSTSVDFARVHGAVVEQAPTLADAVLQLDRGTVDAVVFDRPMLLHFLREHPATNAVLAEGEWETRGYGFALPVGSPHTHELNVALLELAESGRLGAVRLRWLGE